MFNNFSLGFNNQLEDFELFFNLINLYLVIWSHYSEKSSITIRLGNIRVNYQWVSDGNDRIERLIRFSWLAIDWSLLLLIHSTYVCLWYLTESHLIKAIFIWIESLMFEKNYWIFLQFCCESFKSWINGLPFGES